MKKKRKESCRKWVLTVVKDKKSDFFIEKGVFALEKYGNESILVAQFL